MIGSAFEVASSLAVSLVCSRCVFVGSRVFAFCLHALHLVFGVVICVVVVCFLLFVVRDCVLCFSRF